MIARILLLLLALPWMAPAFGAASFQLLTPRATAVAAGESHVISVRFLEADGRPSANELVTFTNDACGVFPNGMGSIALATDGNGIVSVAFTASPPGGITCWVNARAGAAAAVVDVLTYRLAGAYLTVETTPGEPLPGQPFTIHAVPRSGIYALRNVEVSARVIAGRGTASVSPASGNSGMAGRVDFHVAPQSPGDFQVEIDYRGKKAYVQAEPAAPADPPYQDLWWAGPAENGWGLSVVQHGDTLFSVIYAYDDAGRPTWFVMPGGAWDATRATYSGPLYVPTGSPFFDYDASRLLVGPPVGRATLAFTDAGTLVLSYEVGSAGGRKTLTRQAFGPVDAAAAPRVGDMWWGGPAQNGWGLAVLQQYRSLFLVWFTYDASGAPTWYVMSGGTWTDAGTYEGRIHRTTGAPWLGREYDASLFRPTEAGAFRVRFEGDRATFDYSLEGRAGTLSLTRQPF